MNGSSKASSFGKDYFDELLERIREIRASERRFYLKITDIYEQCSIDYYDKNAEITQTFFKTSRINCTGRLPAKRPPRLSPSGPMLINLTWG